MHPSSRLCAVVLAAALVASPSAQQADVAGALRAQIDRIYTEHAYDAPRFGPARWLPDGTAYAIVERAGGGAEIARYDAATGARSVLASTRLDVDDYSWSPDGRRLLIFTNTKKVWRQNTRGDFWVLDVANGTTAPKKLGGDAPEASLMFAKFSPDGARVAYVRQNNLYVERLDDGGIAQLTNDGTPVPAGAAWAPATTGTIVNGTSDWVNEEELDIRDGFRWSPDGSRIAYWQFDTTGVSNMTLVNDTASLYPATTVFAYPKPGTTNSAVRIGVVGVNGGPTTWMKTPGDPRNTYVASLEWMDASTVAMQQLNRLQTENDYLLGDASTGTVTKAFHDAAAATKPAGWVDIQSDVTWVDDGRAFLWLSERDGWRHLYRVTRDGRATLLDPVFGKGKDCKDFEPPALNLGPHVAPLGMKFYTGNQFPAEYKNNIFIAEHGSWNRKEKHGYRIRRVIVDPDGKNAKQEIFAGVWLDGQKIVGRPADIQIAPDGSLLIADDQAGAIYQISYGK